MPEDFQEADQTESLDREHWRRMHGGKVMVVPLHQTCRVKGMRSSRRRTAGIDAGLGLRAVCWHALLLGQALMVVLLLLLDGGGWPAAGGSPTLYMFHPFRA